MNSNKKKLIILGGIGIVSVILLLVSSGSNSNATTPITTAPVSDYTSDFDYNDALNAYDQGKENLQFEPTIKDIDIVVPTVDSTDIYDSENDQIIQAQQQLILENNALRDQLNRQPVVIQAPKEEPKKEVDIYEEMRRAKEATLSNYDSATPKTTVSNTQNSFKAVVYRDQYLKPGQRLTLSLTEDFVYNNKKFKEGTKIYAYVSINQTRILLDVSNIKNTPVSLNAKSTVDYRKGIYSTAAQRLWKKYENSIKEQSSNEIVGDLTQGINTPGVRSTLQSVTQYFNNKNGKEYEIAFRNDLEILFEVK